MTPAAAGAATAQRKAGKLAAALAALAGGVTVFAFAPFEWGALPVVTFAVLVLLWQRAQSPREAAVHGFAFGLGLFGAGVSWLYIALETFGGMAAPLAAVAMALLIAFLSLYPALAGWISVRLARPGFARAVAAAGAFVLTEWLRGWLLSGFPWLTLGYSQVPGGALAGFAPIGGVWLVSLALALCGALLATIVDALEPLRPRIAIAGLVAIAGIASGGALVGGVEWTRASGAPQLVSLVQGNVAQELKFDPEFRERTFALYAELAETARGRLIVLPESAFPVFADELPREIVVRLATAARRNGGDLLFGIFTEQPPLERGNEPRVYNSVVAVGTSDVQLYRKRHLVPFGETIPLKPLVGWMMRSVLAIPIGDQTPGAPDQPPFQVAGERVAVNICYEDAFGDELRPFARAATLLVNVTNDAWYGESIAARQHNQISATRALELGRPMLRATNTGITSAIGHDGRVIDALPWFVRGLLEVRIAGREGETPYVRYGDAVAVGLALVLLAAAAALTRKAGIGNRE
jgi:apolipoprotein N-acyltransferase